MLFTGHFEGLGPRELTKCMRCDKLLGRGVRVRPVFIVGKVMPNPAGAGRVLVLACARDRAIYNEFVHVRCEDPTTKDTALVRPAPKEYPLMPDSLTPAFPEIEPRGEPYRCVLCEKDFERGDRIFTMHMILGIGRSPVSKRPEAAASGNYEVCHASCQDPKLDRGMGLLVVGG